MICRSSLPGLLRWQADNNPKEQAKQQPKPKGGLNFADQGDATNHYRT
jgi:hypothetical protein